jgi:hypothetical protein
MNKNLRDTMGEFIDAISLILFLLGFLMTKLAQLATRYPPFSYFFKNMLFHYNNRDLYDLLRDIDMVLFFLNYRVTLIAAERNYNFLILTVKLTAIKRGKSKPRQYKLIDEKFSEENLLFRPFDKNMAHIMKPRNDNQ